MSPNDEARAAVLNLFYEKNKAARSEEMAEMGIGQAGVKLSNFPREDVSSAIRYLLDQGYLKKRVKTSSFNGSFMPFKGTAKLPSTKIKTDVYRIASKGVDEFEQGSRYKKSHLVLNHTEIHQMTNSVANIGSGKMGDVELTIGLKDFDSLKEIILKSAELSNEDKSDFCGDIETIKTQLQKNNPNKTIIQSAWAAVSKCATIQGATGFIERLQTMIMSQVN